MPSFLEQFSNPHTGVFIERIVYALYGVICAFAGKIYENETRPLILATGLHLVIVVCCGLAAGIYLHWWDNAAGLLGTIVTILIVYAVIWAVLYVLSCAEVNKLNAQLQAEKGE
ncbi:DUF3021 domain-containing protein [Arcanobacterium hippocoleae]